MDESIVIVARECFNVGYDELDDGTSNDMNCLTRWVQRFVIFLIAAATLWLIVMQVFDRLDQRVPLFLALVATYLVAAYAILPVVIHASVALLRRNHIPRVTRAADGLPADPVNIVLIGSQEDLHAAFLAVGWTAADRLTIQTAMRMIKSFLLNRSYPAAPFSALYLFGRKQDLGFQQDIDGSPRKRHHIRFWAADADPETGLGNLAYWTTKRPAVSSQPRIWVGAGTTDTGFGLQPMTWQISHRVDRHADRERDHIVAALQAAGLLRDARYIEAGAQVGTRFISDGRMFHARLDKALPDRCRS
jgi:hypothetical protein